MSFPSLFISFLLLLESNETCPEGCSCIQQNGGDICISCKNGYYTVYNSDDSINNCGKCQANCQECSSSTYCNECESGYYWSNTNCMKCDSNCVTCRTSASQCTSCKDREYVSGDNKCLLCDSTCKTCITTASNCLSCNDGNYLSSNNKCGKCPDICKECENQNKCTSYINNYFLYNYQCLKCNVNWKTTIDGCKCNSCEDGYYIKNYQCFQCNSPCETCENSPNSCIRCITDFFQKENDPLNSCYKDPEGYYLDNDIYIKNVIIHVRNVIDEYSFLLENKFECIKFDFDKISNYLLNYGLDGTESIW